MVARCFCNSCGRETDHEVVYTADPVVYEDDGAPDMFYCTTWRTLTCGGCKQPTLRKTIDYYYGYPDSDKDPIDVTYEHLPPRLWHTPPLWLTKLSPAQAGLKELMREVYTAANEAQPRLLALGIRTVLDTLMNHILTKDYGYFETKLDEMVKQGHLAANERDGFDTIIEAGSAASHRGYMPNQTLLELMLMSMDNLVFRHYIAKPMLKVFSENIPPKPSRAATIQPQQAYRAKLLDAIENADITPDEIISPSDIQEDGGQSNSKSH